MKIKQNLFLTLMVLLAVMFAGAVALAENSEGSGLPSPFSFDSLQGLKEEEWAEAAVRKNAAAMAEYAAARSTLSNGVTIQRVPNDPQLYNVAVLNAQERGCNSCHDLSTSLEWLPLSHPQLANEYDSAEITVDFCYSCHKATTEFAGVNLADSMHALHMSSPYFQSMNGSCMSCHHINAETAQYELWDHAKYKVMNGITKVAADQAVVEMSYNQTEITPLEDVYMYWEDDQKRGIRKNFGEDPALLEDWVITISGDIPETVELDLSAFIEKYKQYEKTDVRVLHCLVDGIGANQIAQVEVTGIPFKYLMEEVGYDDAEGTFCSVDMVGGDGMAWPSGAACASDEALIVYEMNGETLPSRLGYPVQFMMDKGLSGAWIYVKQPSSLKLTQVPGEGFYFIPAIPGFNDVNCGILNYRDGQVFQMGDEIVFEGQAHAYCNQIVSVEYSLDMGETWFKLDTSDSQIGPWVRWSLKIEPQTIGSYVLWVRTTDHLGNQPNVPVQSLFHVE